jgi:hypothetical protein
MRFSVILLICLFNASLVAQTTYNISDSDSIFACYGESPILDASYEFSYIEPVVTGYQQSLFDDDHTSEGFIVTLSDGRLVHFYRMDPGFEGDHISNNGRIVKRVSSDNGISWQSYEEVYNDSMWDDRNIHGGLIGQDSILLFFRKFDAFFMQQIGMFFITSFDGGITWSAPHDIYSINNGTFGSHKLIKIPGLGFIMSISGSYYVEIRYSQDGMDWNNLLHIWDYTYNHLYNFGEACFSYIGNGKIIGLIRNIAQNFGSTYYQVTSSDLGQTWTPPVSTNIAQPYFCPAPMLFYDTLYNDLWALATDRRNYVASEFYADSSRIWVYRNKPDEIFNYPQNYSLVTSMLRPEPSYYRLYGYPTYARKSDGNYLIVFTDSHKKSNNLEDANLYQFGINYDNFISESLHYAWNTGDTSQTLAIDTSGVYQATSSDDMDHSHSDSVYVSLIKSSILQDEFTVEPGTVITLSYDTAFTGPGYHYLWSTGDTISVIHPVINLNTTYFLTIDNGIFSCTDSITVSVFIDHHDEDVIGALHIVNSLTEENNLIVSPNPFSTVTVIYFYNPLKHSLKLIIYDIYGNIAVRFDNITGETIKIDRKNLVSGVYLFRLTDYSGINYSGRIIAE